MKDRAKPLPAGHPLSQEKVLIIAEYIYNTRHQVSCDELEKAIKAVRDAYRGKDPRRSD